jgi:hypothetical protein
MSGLSPIWIRILSPLTYGEHMLLAYSLMLLIMTYEAGMITFILLGLVAGHFFVQLIPPPTAGSSPDQPKPYETIEGTTTPCCAGTLPQREEAEPADAHEATEIAKETTIP